MISLPVQLLLYALSFTMVWVGGGLVVSSIVRLSKSWGLPTFVISFFVLGILTSLPELTIGLSAIADNDPTIFAGNLLGGMIVLFFLIIPLLGLAGGGVSIPKNLDRNETIFTLIVAIAPAFLLVDRQITSVEGLLLVVLYLILFMFVTEKASIWKRVESRFVQRHSNDFPDLVKIIVGVVVLLIASHQIVNTTLYFAELFSVSSFVLSLIVIAIGTNIPELSLILRTVFQKRQEIALADYLGSASANTLLFGGLTLLYGKTIVIPNHILQRFILVVLGIILFYFFARSKNVLSRWESLVLLGIYFLFIWLELSIIR